MRCPTVRLVSPVSMYTAGRLSNFNSLPAVPQHLHVLIRGVIQVARLSVLQAAVVQVASSLRRL